ncbi:MAG: hypothetical protein J1E64_07080 [Acetatifactor sp.]|nr:hypothetical protein [Acetatifactor sp.]
MEMNKFAQLVQERIAERLGESYQVTLQEVCKNNCVMLQGLLILSQTKNVSPTIYLKPFWEAYEKGMALETVVDKILQIYWEDTPNKKVNMNFFKHFEKVRDRICYRLIHAGKNAKLLEDIPHIGFLDLAICFFYAYQGRMLGEGSILIHNVHMEMWETSTAELLRLAQENTPRIFPWECNSMEDVVQEILREQKGNLHLSREEQDTFFSGVPMRILSNRKRVQGAACILYPDVLEQLSAQAGGNLYILPSSIHEVILLADGGREEPELLKEMIFDVNRTQVEPEEILSDSLYYYDRTKKCVKIL